MNTIDLGNGIQLTPEQLQAVIKANPQAFNRYYDEYTNNQKAGIESQGAQAAGDYNRAAQGTVEDYRIAQEKQADAEGRSGTFGSSARAERESSLANKYNRQLQDLYSSTSNNLGNTYRQGEYNIGNVFNKQGIQGYGVNPAMSGTQNTSSYQYNPFNFVGRVNAEKSAATTTAGLGSVANQFYNIKKTSGF